MDLRKSALVSTLAWESTAKGGQYRLDGVIWTWAVTDSSNFFYYAENFEKYAKVYHNLKSSWNYWRLSYEGLEIWLIPEYMIELSGGLVLWRRSWQLWLFCVNLGNYLVTKKVGNSGCWTFYLGPWSLKATEFVWCTEFPWGGHVSWWGPFLNFTIHTVKRLVSCFLATCAPKHLNKIKMHYNLNKQRARTSKFSRIQ